MYPQQSTKTPVYSVFVSNLTQDLKFHRLLSYLGSRFIDYKISKSKNRGKNRFTHAILTLYSKSDYEKVLSEPFVVDNCTCEVSPYIDEAERQKIAQNKMSRRVYINNLADDITRDELADVYGQYGEFEELYLKENYDSRFETKYCFVTFTTQESTWKCLSTSKDHFLKGSKVDFISSEDF